ncbi:serine carboxypeptidase-like family S10 [Thraustotheca clavata]|uniref:Carboxypeptidase n=1 Tax=Thraustotheca clavata TaxID=74557 RepID=A0A1V9ZVT9_9STRA|nr:serine carboxypeptidase-like family S10 [Thraustotheca clavata]
MSEALPLFGNRSKLHEPRQEYSKSILAIAFAIFMCILSGVGLAVTKTNAPVVKLSSDAVEILPHFGPVQELQYSGLITVNDAGGNIFYWFFEARKNDLSLTGIPLIIWLNGGPGASSMTGLMTEMGPYRIDSNGQLTSHPYSWTNVAHMLFFDQPVGTGYTSAKDESGYVNSQEEMAAQLYTALSKFYDLHPEYLSNPIVIAGESYAGKYVPHIAYFIHKQNQQAKEKKMNLWGIAIGNGEMKPVLQTKSVADYALALGLIDQEQFQKHQISLDNCAQLYNKGQLDEAFNICQNTEDEIYNQAGNPFIYDIRQEGNAFNALTSVLSEYFNMPETRAALNVPQGTHWTSIDGSSYGTNPNAPPIARHLLHDELRDVPNSILEDLLNNYQVLFYAGNMDGSSCNHLGIARVIDQLEWNEAKAYHNAIRLPWKVNGKVAGLVKSVDNMSYVVLTNSGHLVPTDQPENALDMITRFINQKAFT